MEKDVRGKINILNVPVDVTDTCEIISKIDGLIASGGKGYITFANVYGITEAQKLNELMLAYKNSWIVAPDGMPLVYIGRIVYKQKKIKRCCGPDVMEAIMAHSVKKGYTHFLYGGEEGVAQELKNKLEEKYPGVQIVGTYTPPFRPLNEAEKRDLLEMVDKLRPNFFWVGLGTPKQEIFMYEYLPLLDTNVMLGVGAAFNFLTGRVKRAPKWMQNLSMEWVYRLAMEPRRLWKRYLYSNPVFAIKFIQQLLRLHKY